MDRVMECCRVLVEEAINEPEGPGHSLVHEAPESDIWSTLAGCIAGVASGVPSALPAAEVLRIAFDRWRIRALRPGSLGYLTRRIEDLQSENETLKEQVGEIARRVDELARDRATEIADYLKRERKLYEFAATLPEPPDYGTDDPWEIARGARDELDPDEFERLFRED